jgi:hypothetical protein
MTGPVDMQRLPSPAILMTGLAGTLSSEAHAPGETNLDDSELPGPEKG